MEERRKQCETCLNNDRTLYPLKPLKCILTEIHLQIREVGEGVCWECKSIIQKFARFRSQVYAAQEVLSHAGKLNTLKSLSALSYGPKCSYNSPQLNSTVTTFTASSSVEIKQERIEKYNRSKTNICDNQNKDFHTFSNIFTANRNISLTVAEIDIIEIDDEDIRKHSDELSTLPRITLVESIIDQDEIDLEDDSNMDIIELNIPLPLPILVEEDEDEPKNPKDRTYDISDVSCMETCGHNDNVVKVIKKEIEDEESIILTTIKEEIIDVEETELEEPNEVMVGAEILGNSEIEEVLTFDRFTATTSSGMGVDMLSPDAARRDHDQWKRSVMLVYNSLRAHKYGSRFLHPISDAKAPGYSQVVKKPMDLNTIRRKIRTGDIRTTTHFQRDILLMLSNALMYNSTNHDIYHMAQDLLKEAQYQLDVLLSVQALAALPGLKSILRPRRNLDKVTTKPKLVKNPLVAPKLEKTVTPKARRQRCLSRKSNGTFCATKTSNVKLEKNASMTRTPTIKNSIPVEKKTTKGKKVKEVNVINLLPVVKLEKCPDLEQKPAPTPTTCRTRRKSTISGWFDDFVTDKDVSRTKRQAITQKDGKKPAVEKQLSNANENLSDVNTKTRNGASKTVLNPVITPKVEKRQYTRRKTKCIEVVSSNTEVPKTNKRKSNVQVDDDFVSKRKRNMTPKENDLVIEKKGRKPKKVIDVPTNSQVDNVCVGKGKRNMTAKVKKEIIEKVKKGKSKPDAVEEVTNKDDLCVAITTETFKDLTREQAAKVKKALEDIILDISLDFSSFAPRFRGKPIIADGVIKLWCEDKQSLDWLRDIIDDLPEKLGKFVVKKQADVPKKIRAALIVPGSTGNIDVIQRLLKSQNPWALVDTWALYSAEQIGENMILVLGIPSTVIPGLLARARRLAFSLGSVYVRFYNLEGELKDTPPVL